MSDEQDEIALLKRRIAELEDQITILKVIGSAADVSDRYVRRPAFMGGTFTPPADMIAAARRDLNKEDFDELMRETGGRPPTPEQLVAKVEARRARS